MKHIIFLTVLLLIPLALADTTFFDNPDDFFIMSDSSATSPTGEVTGGTTGGTTSGGDCLYKWNCTNWSECLPSRKQIRDCINIGTCLNTYNTPIIEQDCTPYTSPETEKEKIDEQDETEKINWKEIVNNKILIYFIISLTILSIIFYLKKNYFKKLIKRQSKINLKRK